MIERIKELSTFTKSTTGLGLLLLIYGFVSRIIPINFFWESKSIGWGLILIGLIGILTHGIERRKKNKKTTIWNKIGIGFICFVFLIQIILVITIPFTDAYQASKEFIMKNDVLKLELGEIKGIGLTPIGGISVHTDSNGKTGNANINLIIKGEKAFKSVTVFVSKEYETEWEVYAIK